MTTCLRGDGRYRLSTWSAITKVQAADDAWNTRRASLFYTENLCGRTRTRHWLAARHPCSDARRGSHLTPLSAVDGFGACLFVAAHRHFGRPPTDIS